MTKTIEFVEKEIENSKKFLDRAINYNLTICFKNETEKLQMLRQIKYELEAWEVVKDNVDVYGHEYNGELVEYVQITEEQLPDEKHINIIKKAKGLEAEYE